MTPLSTLLSGLKRATQDARETLQQLTQKEERLRQERDKLVHAPAAKADVKRLVLNWVDAAGAGYTESLQTALGEFIRRPHLMPAAPAPGHLSPVGAIDAFSGVLEAVNVDRALAALFGDQLRVVLARAVDSMDWGPEGLPMAERSAKVAQLDAAIAEVQAEHARLVQQGYDAGIDLLRRVE